MSFSLTLPTNILDANIVSNNVTDAAIAAFNIATTYALGNQVSVNTTDLHLIYESVIGSNVGFYPPNDDLEKPTNWLLISSTNKHKMFDSAYLTQTENPEVIDVVLQNMGSVNTIWLGNLSAASVQVIITDGGQITHDKTYSLVESGKVNSWFSWYFGARKSKEILSITDIPISFNALFNIKILAPASVAKCGALKVGTIRSFGDVEYGAKFGIDDYGIKKVIQYGITDLREGNYRRYMDLVVWVDADQTDAFNDLLIAYRSKYVIYSATDRFTALNAFGYFESYQGDHRFYGQTIFSINIKGIA